MRWHAARPLCQIRTGCHASAARLVETGLEDLRIDLVRTIECLRSQGGMLPINLLRDSQINRRDELSDFGPVPFKLVARTVIANERDALIKVSDELHCENAESLCDVWSQR